MTFGMHFQNENNYYYNYFLVSTNNEVSINLYSYCMDRLLLPKGLAQLLSVC